MSKNLGRMALLVVALAAVLPFFHVDDHPSGCAVCIFAAAGNVQLSPEVFVLSEPILDFCGLAPSPVDSCLESRTPVRGGRAPPIVL